MIDLYTGHTIEEVNDHIRSNTDIGNLIVRKAYHYENWLRVESRELTDGELIYILKPIGLAEPVSRGFVLDCDTDIYNDPLSGWEKHKAQMNPCVSQWSDSCTIVGITDQGYLAKPHEDSGPVILDITGNHPQWDTLGVPVHGLSVTGQVNALTNNNLGKSSIAPATPVIQYHGISYIGIYECALKGARVINCSWANFGSPNHLENQMITDLAESGILVVGSAGNNTGGANAIIFPASQNHVLSVGGINLNWENIFQKNEYVDILAPAKDVRILKQYNKYNIGTGTSYSAPIVAGLAQVLFSIEPGLSVYGITQIIKGTGFKIDTMAVNSAYDPIHFGGGVLQAEDAVDSLWELKTSGNWPSGFLMKTRDTVYLTRSDNQYRLDAGMAAGYYWSDGDTTRNKTVSPGIYWVDKLNMIGCIMHSDTFVVKPSEHKLAFRPEFFGFLGFWGEPEVEGNYLHWNLNDLSGSVDHYSVERSPNGLEWKAIEKTPGKNILDTHPMEESYYRISAVEHNGNINYSKTLRIVNHNPPPIVKRQGEIMLFQGHCTLYNVLGQPLGNYENEINLSYLPQGIYIISFENGSSLKINR